MKKKKIMEKKKERNINLQRIINRFLITGFYYLRCDGWVKRAFDLQVESIYSEARNPILIKVEVGSISKKVKKAVEDFKTKKGKEIWLTTFGEAENDPGKDHVYRFEGSELIQDSQDLPLDDAMGE